MTALIEGRDGEADATDDISAKTTELYNEFNNLLFKARNQLMSKEVILHDQMEVCDINLQKVSNKINFKIELKKFVSFCNKRI